MKNLKKMTVKELKERLSSAARLASDRFETRTLETTGNVFDVLDDANDDKWEWW